MAFLNNCKHDDHFGIIVSLLLLSIVQSFLFIGITGVLYKVLCLLEKVENGFVKRNNCFSFRNHWSVGTT